MNKKLLQELKEKLEKEKETIEKELEGFANKDPRLKGDWDVRFPDHSGGSGGSGGQILEDAADEVEEYVTSLPIEFSLETRLRDIDLALEKIKKGKSEYGICKNCEGKIDEERLKVCPEAKICLKCGD